jgi:hypothetical protein
MDAVPLTFESLLEALKFAVSQIRDPRQASNGQRYPLQDIILSAFSVFFMQCESFLEYQRQMQSRFGRDNAQTIFGIPQIPSDPQIRNVMDQVSASAFFGVFDWVYQRLQQNGFLKSYEVLGHQLLVTLDGTQYFNSHRVHGEQCSHRTHATGRVSYFHSAVLPAIVAPGKSEVMVSGIHHASGWTRETRL